MKKILSFLLVLVTVLSLVGCGAQKEEEKIGKDTYFGQLKEFKVTVDGKDLSVPMDYSDLVMSFDFIANDVYREDKYEYGKNKSVGAMVGERFLNVNIQNLDSSKWATINETTVVGAWIWVKEGIEFSSDISHNDTMDTIKDKFGDPDFRNYDNVTCYYYDIPHLSTEHYRYGIEFVFNDDRTLKIVKFGDTNCTYID